MIVAIGNGYVREVEEPNVRAWHAEQMAAVNRRIAFNDGWRDGYVAGLCSGLVLAAVVMLLKWLIL